jgi:hypothetical protein
LQARLIDIPADARLSIGAGMRAGFDEYLAEWQQVR